MGAKGIRSEQLSNTVQLQHEDITNPTVTHADKFVNAIINTIRNLENSKNKSDIRDFNQLLEVTNRIVKRNKDKATKEATEPSSTNLTKTVNRNGDRATDKATDPSSTNSNEPSPHTNPLQRVPRSM